MQNIEKNLNNVLILSYTVMNIPISNLLGPIRIQDINKLNYSLSHNSKEFRDFIQSNSNIYFDFTEMISDNQSCLYFHYAVFNDPKLLLMAKLKFHDQILKLEDYIMENIKDYFTDMNLGENNE